MKIAAFTIARNEDVFLPVWFKYYKKHIPEKDIFIYDNDSINPVPENIATKIHSEYTFDHRWLRQTAFKIMSYLLMFYDYVLCTDADEILIADPRKYKNITDYVQKNPNEIMYSTGYEIVGNKKDTPINFSENLFNQRKEWVKLKNFYKPVLSSVPIRKMYSDYNCSSNGDPDLYLVHLNRIDYKTSLDKHKASKKYNWNPSDLNKTDGWQHRIKTDAAFDDYYTKIKNATGKAQPIPEWIKGTI